MTALSPELLFDPIRRAVDAWRGFELPEASAAWTQEGAYTPTHKDEAPLSPTTLTLLRWWFRSTPHELPAAQGNALFRYWPHQRRFIETVIYLHEVRGLRSVDRLYAGFGVRSVFSGVDPWAKLGGQLATGSGKTKMMSLLIAWSVLNATREGPGHLGMGPQAVVVAPGLFVRDRLLQDFRPVGRASVFDADPVIPPSLSRSWGLKVYGPEDCPRALGADEQALIVTNIQQLARAPETPPPLPAGVGRQAALLFSAPDPARLEDTGTPLLERLRPGKGALVINDEAHHVKDEPDHQRFEQKAAAQKRARVDTPEELQWIGALRALHERVGLGLQVDLSATLYAEEGGASKAKKAPPRLFRHAVMSYPLAEAIRDGVVKRPILERVSVGERGGAAQPTVLKNQPNAWLTYQPLLLAGIGRWMKVRDQLRAEGDPRKPILFLLCADQKEAREVANMLTYNVASPQDLDGGTITGWTHPETGERLFVEPDAHGAARSTVVQVHVGAQQDRDEAEWAKVRASVNAIDHDALPDPSGALDEHGAPRLVPNPYNVVVSVMMLKEGWDVRNVKVIVPLRACDSRTLAEQTLGRGLRRMHPPIMDEYGATRAVREELYVIEHPSFTTILEQLHDLVELRHPGEIEHPPEYLRVELVADLAAREAANLRLVKFVRERVQVGAWRASFRLPTVAHAQKLAWWGEFVEREVSTELWDAQSAASRDGQRFIIPAAPTYTDMDEVIELAYVMPLVRTLQVGAMHKNDVKAVVKETLKHSTFQLPPGIPAPVDESLHSHASARVALCNFVRPDVIQHVKTVLLPPLREALSARKVTSRADLDVRFAVDLPSYAALREHELPQTTRSVYAQGVFDSEDERAFAERLGRCEDVQGWVYNHRKGVAFFIEMDWQGHTVRYFPDFIVRAQLGGRIHNLIVEVKGRMDRRDEAKAQAGRRYATVLATYDDEPWHYLLVHQDPKVGRAHLTDWARMSPPSIGALLAHVERLGDDEAGNDPLTWRLLTRSGVRGAIERLVERAEDGLPFAELTRLAETGAAPLGRLLEGAEGLVNGRTPRLRRVFVEERSGVQLPEEALRARLAEAAQGVPDALKGVEVVYRPVGGPHER